jgi:hypothetical protein
LTRVGRRGLGGLLRKIWGKGPYGRRVYLTQVESTRPMRKKGGRSQRETFITTNTVAMNPPGFGFRVSGFGVRVSGFGFRDSSFGVRDSGFGIRVSSFGTRDSGSHRHPHRPSPAAVSADASPLSSVPPAEVHTVGPTPKSEPRSGIQRSFVNSP